MKYLLLLISLCAPCALAQPTWHTSKIKLIYPQANGGVVFAFAVDHPECINASNPKYFYMGPGFNGLSEDGFKNMYSAALMAAASGKAITINFDSSNNDCAINRLSVAFD